MEGIDRRPAHSPGGSAIPMVIESRGYIHGSSSILKRWDFLEIQGFVTGDSAASILVDTKVDESSAGFANLGTVRLPATGSQYPVIPFFLPFNPSGGRTQRVALGLRSLLTGHILEVRLRTLTLPMTQASLTAISGRPCSEHDLPPAGGPRRSRGWERRGQSLVDLPHGRDSERSRRGQHPVELVGPQDVDAAGRKRSSDQGPVSLDEAQDALDRDV